MQEFQLLVDEAGGHLRVKEVGWGSWELDMVIFEAGAREKEGCVGKHSRDTRDSKAEICDDRPIQEEKVLFSDFWNRSL